MYSIVERLKFVKMHVFLLAWASALPKGARSRVVEAAIILVYYIIVFTTTQVKFGN